MTQVPASGIGFFVDGKAFVAVSDCVDKVDVVGCARSRRKEKWGERDTYELLTAAAAWMRESPNYKPED